jgi:hypothetical protein
MTMKTRMFRFRATAEQGKDIEKLAQNRGYVQLSPYLLNSALGKVKLDVQLQWIKKEIEEIKNHLNGLQS